MKIMAIMRLDNSITRCNQIRLRIAHNSNTVAVLTKCLGIINLLPMSRARLNLENLGITQCSFVALPLAAIIVVCPLT